MRPDFVNRTESTGGSNSLAVIEVIVIEVIVIKKRRQPVQRSHRHLAQRQAGEVLNAGCRSHVRNNRFPRWFMKKREQAERRHLLPFRGANLPAS